MKYKNHRFITHLNKGYMHLWIFPSIEVDKEHFKNESLGEYRWLHITASWLLWSIDIEWEG